MTVVQPALAPPRIVAHDAPDGSRILRSEMELEPYEASLGLLLRHWAREAPDRVFLAERGRRRRMGRAHLGRGRRAGPTRSPRRCSTAGWADKRPVMILSGNSIDQAVLTLGGFLAGVPVVPVSPAYSLMSQDYGKVKHIASLIKPGLVYARGRRAVRRRARPPSTSAAPSWCSPAATARRASPTWSPRSRRWTSRTRWSAVGPDSVAKILFTSGLDGDAQGRHQHPRDAVGQPAVAGADLAVHRRHAAGARGLAAVEPHLRRQPQLQPDPQARRDAVHRRRPPGAAADPDHGAQPDRDRADDLLQRPRRLRRAAAVPGARRGAAREASSSAWT